MLAIGALTLLGLVMMTSASISIADRTAHEPLHYLERQAIGIGLGLLAALVMMTIPCAVWERMALPLLVLALVLLVLVLIPGIGHEVNGSRRWLRLGIMNFQASELARVLLLIVSRKLRSAKTSGAEGRPQRLSAPLMVLMAAAGLLLLEPDFGAATVLLATGLGMLFLAGVKLRHFFALVAIAARRHGGHRRQLSRIA